MTPPHPGSRQRPADEALLSGTLEDFAYHGAAVEESLKHLPEVKA